MTRIENQILGAVENAGVDAPGFYGTVSFHFQRGALKLIRIERTIAPVESEDTNPHGKSLESR